MLPAPQEKISTGPFKQLHNVQSIYMRIGDRLSEVLGQLPFEELRAIAIVPAMPAVLYALVTLFQYAEGVSDLQAAQAVCTRLDWKYALQLPIDFTGIDPACLCTFRLGTRESQLAQKGLERLLNALTDQGLIARRERTTTAQEVIRSVCMLNRLETMLVAMGQALKGAATQKPDWLQAHIPTHWMERYPCQTKNSLPVNWEKQNHLAQQIAEDALYFIALAQPETALTARLSSELHHLKVICQMQLKQEGGELRWSPPPCKRCIIL
ncbi:MAG: transposase [Anaerolineales bacterium]|nr:transposase [Anaerolineales bacterium]